jgi:hypothetical protein
MTKAILLEVLILLLETFIVWLYKKIMNTKDNQENYQTSLNFS